MSDPHSLHSDVKSIKLCIRKHYWKRYNKKNTLLSFIVLFISQQRAKQAEGERRLSIHIILDIYGKKLKKN